METPALCSGRASLVAFLQALPLTWVARLGRCGGALAYWLDARHRRVALRNLTHVLRPGEIAGRNPRAGPGEFPAHRRELRLRRQDRRHELRGAASARGIRRAIPASFRRPPARRRRASSSPSAISGTSNSTPASASLRPLTNAPPPTAACASLRSTACCSRCASAPAACSSSAASTARRLRAAMNQPGVMLGLLSDQHAGDRLRLPFLGPRLLHLGRAGHLRAALPLPAASPASATASAWPAGASKPAPEIPTHENGQPRVHRRHHARREPRLRSRRSPRPGQLVLGAQPVETQES